MSLDAPSLDGNPKFQASKHDFTDKADAIVYLDASRLPTVRDIGFDHARIHWTGADRVTSALGLSTELQKGVSTYRADTLNLPAFAGLFAAAGM
ncbi:MAG TPA: hypothetical protein VIK01_14975 [Polyangiaceae bacterium]